jgi:hypothetical protein
MVCTGRSFSLNGGNRCFFGNSTKTGGVFMLALENGEAGNEMSVLWGAGRARDVDLTLTVLPMIETIAAQFDCKAVFFLTRRQGLIRKAEKIGFSYYETVMKKVI